jgi:AcrR family transcriptional regulator
VSVKETRREALLNAATEILTTNPTASLADIASHAGIGTATLHRYFSSREDLLLALGYRALDAIGGAIVESRVEEGTATEALTRLIDALVPLADRLYVLMNDSTLDTHPEFIEADRITQEPILKLIKRGQKSGELRSELPADWILHQMNFALYATWIAIYEGEVAPRHASKLLTATLLGGIATS